MSVGKVFNFMDYMDSQIHFFIEKFKKNGWVQIKFYIHQSYPKGYWQNHTLG
jgi:hypothetical protein